MKRIAVLIMTSLIVVSCGVKTKKDDNLKITLDLVNINEDRVMVTHNPGVIEKDAIKYFIPKTIPGTYAINDYGQFSENFKAYNYDGEEIDVERINDNTWQIKNAQELDKVTYLVNDTFDMKGEGGTFSPAGTNIDKDENFMLNLHGFVGYFTGMQEETHELLIQHPDHLVSATTLPLAKQTEKENFTVDQYVTDRYFGIIDNPIMYAEPDTTSFDIQGMKVQLSMYSPNDTYSTDDLKSTLEEMVQAQKSFLGEIDNTPVYNIMLYLSDQQKPDARGFGALEHHTSTSVVLPESIPKERLKQSMTDIVSHEFFHIITPLNVHSKEVHYFGYNNPDMSQHLWMYEGVTEYFANLFQINQGLISEDDFYQRINDKIQTASSFDRSMSFTKMSKNIYDDPYKDSYYNVYQKGALIGMCLDIRLRELSDGQMGILDLMKQLVNKYGKDKPFNDDALFDEIVAMTYPEIADFFDKHVKGTTPLSFDKFFAKVGLEKETKMQKTGYFLDGQNPFINVDQSTGDIFFRKSYPMNTYFKDLGLQPGDVIKSINGEEFSMQNVRSMIGASMGWQAGDDFKIIVTRDGKDMSFKGELEQPMLKKSTLKAKELDKESEAFKLRQAWLKS